MRIESISARRHLACLQKSYSVCAKLLHVWVLAGMLLKTCTCPMSSSQDCAPFKKDMFSHFGMVVTNLWTKPWSYPSKSLGLSPMQPRNKRMECKIIVTRDCSSPKILRIWGVKTTVPQAEREDFHSHAFVPFLKTSLVYGDRQLAQTFCPEKSWVMTFTRRRNFFWNRMLLQSFFGLKVTSICRNDLEAQCVARLRTETRTKRLSQKDRPTIAKTYVPQNVKHPQAIKISRASLNKKRSQSSCWLNIGKNLISFPRKTWNTNPTKISFQSP